MPWEVLFVVGTVALAVGLAFAMNRHRTRSRRNDRIGEVATKELYEHPEHYDETKRELEKQLER